MFQNGEWDTSVSSGPTSRFTWRPLLCCMETPPSASKLVMIAFDGCTVLSRPTYWSHIDGAFREFPRGYASPLNVVAPKSISRIRRVSVFIKLPGTDDEGRWVSNQANISYHSYNDTFEGCLNAMEGQMSALFTVLRQIKEIQDLEMFMWLDIPQPHKRCDRKLLSPLLSLENVRKGSLFGDISPEFEQEVQDHFRSSAAKS